MSDIFLIVGLGIVTLLIWKIAQSFSANKFLEEIASKTSREDAVKELNECLDFLILRQNSGNKSGGSQKEANQKLERAAWMQDRINQIDGLPHGPAARLNIRAGYLRSMKSMI